MKYVIRWRGGYMEFSSMKDLSDWMKAQNHDFPNICLEVR
tara:strand:- start:370 stop:489 length:120 start_codon:yes stop_codon:yes gene_type:complete